MAAPSGAAIEPLVEESEAEEPMFENRESHDGAQPSEEEAAMAEGTMKAHTEELEIGGPVPEVDESVDMAPSASRQTDERSAEPNPDPRPVADDLFEAVPTPARHFLALLEREGMLLMPQVMAHLGLVRPKGVGGAIEPVQRIARLIGVELPFVADFAPSGYKRWTWRARPLAEVPAELLEPLPAPPPQAKKPKARPKVDRTRYKKAWRRSLEQKKRGKGRGHGTDKRRSGAKRAAPSQPAVERRAPRVPAAHRDESGNTGRAPRRAPTSAPPAEARRKRHDRPMPEVFRRANRPAARPAAPAPRRDEARREDVARTEEAPPRVARHEERMLSTGVRPTVPRLERPAADATPSLAASDDAQQRRGVATPEERLPLPRSGVFRRRTVSDTDVPVVVIRRRKR